MRLLLNKYLPATENVDILKKEAEASTEFTELLNIYNKEDMAGLLQLMDDSRWCGHLGGEKGWLKLLKEKGYIKTKTDVDS